MVTNLARWKSFANGAILYGPPGVGQNLNQDLEENIGNDLDALALHALGDGIYDGFTVSAGAGLSVNIAAGTGYALGQRVVTTGVTNVAGLPASTSGIKVYFQALAPFNVTNVGWDGTFSFTTGALPAGAVLLATATTDGASVTLVTDGRVLLGEAAKFHATTGHDHSGVAGKGPKLVQANTHQSPDTDTGASALHHTLGTGANQAAAGNHVHDGAAITTGTIAKERLGTGTPGAGKYVDGAAGAWTTLPAATQLRETFKGLQLQTHPDSDKRRSQVMLVHADAVLMDDGTVITGLDRKVADITVAGAGGLDTGAEGASRHYDIYLIGKSADGTGIRAATANDTLLLHRAKDWTVTTSFTTTPDATRALRLATGTATDKIAQGFQMGAAGPVPFIDVQLSRLGAVSGNVWFTLEADTAGAPSGTPLATSDKIDASKIETVAQTLRLMFRTPANLSAAGTQYYLVLQGDYARSDTVHIRWHGLVAGGYANGASIDFNGTNWTATPGANGLDRWFKIFVEQNNAAVTMPATYDQKALIGSVYNDAGSDFVRMRAIDRLVEVFSVAAVATGNVSTFLADLSAFMPPHARMVSLGGIEQGSGSAALFYTGVGNDLDDLNGTATQMLQRGIPSLYFPSSGSYQNGGPMVSTEAQAVYARLGGNLAVYPRTYSW